MRYDSERNEKMKEGPIYVWLGTIVLQQKEAVEKREENSREMIVRAISVQLEKEILSSQKAREIYQYIWEQISAGDGSVDSKGM